MTKVETARSLALEVLEDVFIQQAYSNIALNKHLKGSQLSAADKGLVTELVYGTVARKLTLEWYLSHFIEDRDKLDSWLYVLLLMSVYQLQYLDKLLIMQWSMKRWKALLNRPRPVPLVCQCDFAPLFA